MLIGRDPEVERIEGMLAAAREGRSGTLLVTGPAGIGKTALAGHAVQRARAADMVVLRAGGIEAETDVPFAGLSELLGPVLGQRETLEPLHRAVLGVALGLEAGSQPPPFSVGVALLALLGAAAEDLPEGLLVVIDDAQWLDAGSLEALLFAARRLGREGAVLLLAARTEPDRGLLARGLEHLPLEGLAEEHAYELVAASADGRAPRNPRDIVELSGGYPLCLIELARVEYHAEGYPPIRGDVRPTEAIERAFARDLELLDEPSRDALMVVAAGARLGRSQVAEAMQLLGLPPGALDAPERAGLFLPDCDHPVFRHPLLRHVVYYGGSARWRAAVHAALAEVTDGFQRAWHLGQATQGPDARAATALAEAGEQAAARGDLAAGARALIRAVALTPDGTDEAPRALAAAEMLAASGSLAEARQIAERALAEPIAEDGVRADLERVRGTVLGRAGLIDEGMHPLLDQAGRVAATDPARAVVLLLGSCPALWLKGDYERFRTVLDRAVELARPGHPELLAMAGLLGSLLQAGVADLAGAERAIETSAWVLDRAGLPDPGYELLGTPALVSVWTERLDRAAALTERQLDLSRREGAVAALAFPLTVRGLIAARSGRASVALAAGSEAAVLAADTGQGTLEALALATLAQTEALLGREAEARGHALAALDAAGSTGALHVELLARSALSALDLGLGKIDEAAASAVRCAQIARATGLREPNVARWHGDAVETLLRTGQRDEAEAVAAELEERLATSPTAWTEAAAARARDLLAPSTESGERLDRAIEALDRVGDAFAAAHLRLGRGERLRRAKKRLASRPPLTAALEVFSRVGAQPWAARAAAELRATGAPSRTAETEPSATGELTAHELRVALLVAEGRTNPEVAAELFVSRKTVEFHLSHVYRKLGLRSRTELAHRLTASA